MYALVATIAVAILLAASQLREHMTPQAVTTRAPVNAPTPLIGQTSMDFGQAIEIFKENYVAYKTSGRVEFKTAYENAQSWIEQYLSSMQNRISSGSREITDFVSQQAGADTELGTIGAKMRQVKTEGPAAQDAYTTIKRINEDIPEDNTNLYVKAGIVIALAGVAGIMSA